MAKRKAKIKNANVRTRAGTGVRRAYRRAKSTSGRLGLGKMRWGEVILSAIVGYEGGNVLNSTGLPNMLSSANAKLGDAMYQQSIAMKNAGYSVPGYGTVINKDLGLVAIVKSAYDVVKKHKLDDVDKNILIPYAVGTIFDKKVTGSGDGGVW